MSEFTEEAKAPEEHPTPPQQSPPNQNISSTPKKSKKGCYIFAVILGVVLVFFTGAFLIVFFGFALIGALTPSGFGDLPAQGNQAFYNEQFVSGDSGSANKIVVVSVEGVILRMKKGGAFYQVANSAEIKQQIRYAAQDPMVKGLVIWLNTPGGEVVASDVIHHEILEYRKKTQKPAIACMGPIATSGGYYVAAACDKIVAHRLSLTGSIGVIIQGYKYFDLLKKVGVQAEVYASGPMKDLLSGSRPSTPGEKELIQNLINGTYNEFVKIVADGRKGLSVDKIKNSIIGDGRIFSGQQAFELKLVDQLGFFEDAVAQSAKLAKLGKNYRVVRYQEPFSLAKIFTKASAGDKRRVELKLPGTADREISLEAGRLYFLPTSW